LYSTVSLTTSVCNLQSKLVGDKATVDFDPPKDGTCQFARRSVENSELISHLQVLEPASWPNDESCIIYGEQSVVTLAKHLKLDCRPTIEQFRKLKDGK